MSVQAGCIIAEALTRRHLPHVDRPGAIVFITFRLAGSLPEAVLQELRQQAALWKRELDGSPESRILLHKRAIALADKYLDEAAAAGAGPLHLKNPAAAGIVIKHMNWGMSNKRYLLHRYCVMPNHAHMLLEAMPRGYEFAELEASWEAWLARRAELEALNSCQDRQECLSYWQLAEIMKGLKGVSAREINLALGLQGSLWQDENFDHVVRGEVEYYRICDYIDQNPVKAGWSPTPATGPTAAQKSRTDILVCQE